MAEHHESWLDEVEFLGRRAMRLLADVAANLFTRRWVHQGFREVPNSGTRLRNGPPPRIPRT